MNDSIQRFGAACAAALLLLIGGAIVLSRQSGATRSAAPQASYLQLPLRFEADETGFTARGANYALHLTGDEATLALRAATGDRRQGRRAPADTAATQASTVRMKIVGANPAPTVVGLDELPGRSHYFIGNDPQRWRGEVLNYGKVAYRHVYPDIDLVYYGKQQELEYDWIVAPGGDPQQIELAFTGVERMRIDAAGNLVLHTPGGEIVQRKPVVYQEADGVRQTISGSYAIRHQRVGFELGAYDRTRPLVIDPVFNFVTYFGAGTDFVTDVAVDAAGNAYLLGSTTAADFVTLNPARPVATGGTDVFVVKLNPAGQLVYSTYLGGSGGEFGAGLAVDAGGNVYIGGQTGSGDFPVLNAFQERLAGDQNAFVTRLNADGNALVYSSYLGSSGFDFCYGIAVDGAGSAYVVCDTDFGDFPTTEGSLKPVFPADAINVTVTKFHPAGRTLIYSTFLGGSDFDLGGTIAVDAPGNAVVAGFPNSSDFPTTPNAAQRQYAGGADIFVSKLNATGSALLFSTFLGGAANDSVNDVTVDTMGNIYVAGLTGSANFPVTTAAFQRAYAGGNDAFLVKYSPGGEVLLSSFFGGTGGENVGTVRADGIGNVYFSGSTNSANLPTVNPLQANLRGGGVFVTADGGANWSAANRGLLSLSINGLAIDPTTPTTVYAAGGGGVFKSTDSGANWSAINNGLAGNPVNVVAVDPRTPATLLAATNIGLFRSTDGGMNWSAANNGLTGSRVMRSVAFDPNTAMTAYAGATSIVYKSLDGGLNWTRNNVANAAGPMQSLAFHPTDPMIIFAGSANTGTAGGVYVSTDGGRFWLQIASGLTNRAVRAIAVDPVTPTTLYAATGGGFFRSTNLGGNWSRFGTGLDSLDLRALVLLPTTPPTFYATTANGVFRSLNGGLNWMAANNGITTPIVTALAVNRANPAMLLAGTFAADAYVAKVNPGGSLIFATYFGGVAGDNGTALAAQRAGGIYLAGNTVSTDLAVTPGAYQSAPGGFFVARISDNFTCTNSFTGTLVQGSRRAGEFQRFTATILNSSCSEGWW